MKIGYCVWQIKPKVVYKFSVSAFFQDRQVGRFSGLWNIEHYNKRNRRRNYSCIKFSLVKDILKNKYIKYNFRMIYYVYMLQNSENQMLTSRKILIFSTDVRNDVWLQLK